MRTKLFIIPVALIATSIANSDTLQVAPVKDNTIFEHATNGISNGAGIHSFIGKTNGGLTRRTLTQFDVSAIPPGSVVNSVEVIFTITKAPNGAQASSAGLNLLLVDWGERFSNAGNPGGGGAAAQAGDATWLHAFHSTQTWNTVGGDYNPTVSGLATYGTSNNEVMTFTSNINLIADVQLWVDTPANNYGWIMRGDEANNQNARRMKTRENAVGSPMLVIDYTLNNDLIFENGFEN